MNIGVISGHPLPGLLEEEQEVITVETKYGMVTLRVAKHSGHKIFFLNRHGEPPTNPPHKINYRGNIEALYLSHVENILSIGTVGSMNPEIKPGDFVIPHDFFDATKNRVSTFYDDKRFHVDMIDPFCPSLRTLLAKYSSEVVTTHPRGVYLATEGPRLETISEIKFYSSIADIVGMTIIPEVILAREKGICYASLCIVCNMAAGLQDTLPVDDIKKIFDEREAIASKVIEKTIQNIEEKESCSCREKMEKALL